MDAGERKPATKEEKAFVAFCRGERAPETFFEKTWNKISQPHFLQQTPLHVIRRGWCGQPGRLLGRLNHLNNNQKAWNSEPFVLLITMQNLPVTHYSALLAEKQEKLTALLAPFNAPDLQVFASPTQHFRMRAEFRIWHEGDDFYHIMFDQQSKQRYRVDNFPIASELINRMMTALLPLLKQQTVLHHRLFQIDYLSTQSQQIIVSLLYHKALDENWQAAAQTLRSQLQQQGFNVQIVGRASKQKICLEQDYVDEILNVHGKDYIYRQVENSFTQPNAAVNSKMLEMGGGLHS